MWPPGVVPLCKLRAQSLEMVEAFDDRHPKQPLIFQSPDHALGHRNAAMLAHCTEAMLDPPRSQQLFERGTSEDRMLVRDQMPRRAVAFEGFVERIAHPAGVGSFERSDSYNLAREVIDRDEDVCWPQAPAQDCAAVDRPDVVRVEGWDAVTVDRRVLGTFARALPGWLSRRSWPQEDVANRGRGQEIFIGYFLALSVPMIRDATAAEHNRPE